MHTVHRPWHDTKKMVVGMSGVVQETAEYKRDYWTAIGWSNRPFYYYTDSKHQAFLAISSERVHFPNVFRFGSSNMSIHHEILCMRSYWIPSKDYQVVWGQTREQKYPQGFDEKPLLQTVLLTMQSHHTYNEQRSGFLLFKPVITNWSKYCGITIIYYHSNEDEIQRFLGFNLCQQTRVHTKDCCLAGCNAV